MNSLRVRPQLLSQLTQNNKIAAAVCQSMEFCKEMILLDSFNISQNTDEASKQIRERNLSDIQEP